MANETTRLSTIIDLMWDKDVSTAKKTTGSDQMVKHLMGQNYTPEAFSALSNDQKADAILTAMRANFINMVRGGGQRETQATLEQQIVEGGNAAVDNFNPDQT